MIRINVGVRIELLMPKPRSKKKGRVGLCLTKKTYEKLVKKCQSSR